MRGFASRGLIKPLTEQPQADLPADGREEAWHVDCACETV